MTAVDLRIDHLDIALRYAAAPEEWPVAPRFSPTERWYHRAGCRQFFVVERDTVTDQTRDPRAGTVSLNAAEPPTAEPPANQGAP